MNTYHIQNLNSNVLGLKNSQTATSLDNTADKNDNLNKIFIEVGEGHPRNFERSSVNSIKNSANSQRMNNVEVLDNMDVRK